MRILVTNDDGVEAPGIKVLQKIAEQLSDDVWVVAPEKNQSGASHSLTLHEPLRFEQVGERKYSVRGTPTDCVIVALRHILIENPPTLVLSGVNRGSNIAEDVTYSGTIAGAIEASLLGVRAIAMSLSTHGDHDASLHWDSPLKHGPEIIERLLGADMPQGVFANVNFPDLPAEEVKGLMVTSQGRRDQNLLHIDERFDPWGAPYYWLAFERRRSSPAEGTDLWAIYEGMISVTPLHADLTHPKTHNALLRSLEGMERPLRRTAG